LTLDAFTIWPSQRMVVREGYCTSDHREQLTRKPHSPNIQPTFTDHSKADKALSIMSFLVVRTSGPS
jgi:hypothetical protein